MSAVASATPLSAKSPCSRCISSLNFSCSSASVVLAMFMSIWPTVSPIVSTKSKFTCGILSSRASRALVARSKRGPGSSAARSVVRRPKAPAIVLPANRSSPAPICWISATSASTFASPCRISDVAARTRVVRPLISVVTRLKSPPALRIEPRNSSRWALGAFSSSRLAPATSCANISATSSGFCGMIHQRADRTQRIGKLLELVYRQRLQHLLRGVFEKVFDTAGVGHEIFGEFGQIAAKVSGQRFQHLDQLAESLADVAEDAEVGKLGELLQLPERFGDGIGYVGGVGRKLDALEYVPEIAEQILRIEDRVGGKARGAVREIQMRRKLADRQLFERFENRRHQEPPWLALTFCGS